MTVIRLPEPLRNRLQEQADRENRTLSNMVVRHITLRLESLDPSE